MVGSNETKGMGSQAQGYENTVSLSKGHDKLFVCVNVYVGVSMWVSFDISF